MATQRKIFTVQNLAEKFRQAKGLILTDYTSLNVAQISDLRKQVKKAGGEFEVVKNSLLKLATIQDRQPKPILARNELRGPTAALWIYGETLEPLRALAEFIKKTELPKIKFGFWEGNFLSLEAVKELANLPGLEEMRARLVNRLQSPISRLQQVLWGDIWKLIHILNYIKNTRDKLKI